MAWIPDQLDTLVLDLSADLRDVGAFCYHWNWPAQRAFAEHIRGLGKPTDMLTVADLKDAAAHADAVTQRLIEAGVI